MWNWFDKIKDATHIFPVYEFQSTNILKFIWFIQNIGDDMKELLPCICYYLWCN